MHEYLGEEYSKIKADPLYQEFIEFKEEAMALNKNAFRNEHSEDDKDIFKYDNSQYSLTYFDDDDGPSWNSTTQSP